MITLVKMENRNISNFLNKTKKFNSSMRFDHRSATFWIFLLLYTKKQIKIFKCVLLYITRFCKKKKHMLTFLLISSDKISKISNAQVYDLIYRMSVAWLLRMHAAQFSCSFFSKRHLCSIKKSKCLNATMYQWEVSYKIPPPKFTIKSHLQNLQVIKIIVSRWELISNSSFSVL